MKTETVAMVDKTQTFNVTDIWQRTNNIGYTLHTNLTDGTTRIVKWGHLEWIGAATSAALGLIGFTAFCIGIVTIILPKVH